MQNAYRNTEVDAIRAAALIGICIVNVPFMGLPLSEVLAPPVSTGDRIAMFIVAALFQGKFFILFSFIFGWGLFVQERAAERAGVSFNARYFRRLIGLFLIGIAHALLVFTGDILVLYALLGVVIWFLRNLSPGALLWVAAAMVPVAAVARVLLLMAVSGDTVAAEGGPTLGGSYAEATAARIAEYPTIFVFVLLINGPLAMGAFAAGLAAAKVGFFERDNAQFERVARTVPLLLVTGIMLNAIYGAQFSGMLFPRGSVLGMIASVQLAIAASCLSVVYIFGIVRLARRLNPSPPWLASGRNSLSTYVMQGILAGFVFGAYGFGWFELLGRAELLALSLVIAGITLVFASLVYGVFRRGPMEHVLRMITRGPRSA